MNNKIANSKPNSSKELIEEDLDEMDERNLDEMQEYFNKELWPKAKKDLREMSKKESCFYMFVAGTKITERFYEEDLKKGLKKLGDKLKNMSGDEIKNLLEEENDEEILWEEESFAESLGPKEIEEKMKTFHKKHDEDINFNCKKCNKKISAHNKNWHAGLCDDCFNE